MKPIDKSGLNGVPLKVAPVAPPANGTQATRTVAERSNQAAASTTLSALMAGEAPKDASRVREVRKAIEEGRYPIVPARIADALIAAGYLLRIK